MKLTHISKYLADCLLKNRDWEYESEQSLSFTDSSKKQTNKQTKQKNRETFKEGSAPIISGYLSAVHFIQVGLS